MNGSVITNDDDDDDDRENGKIMYGRIRQDYTCQIINAD